MKLITLVMIIFLLPSCAAYRDANNNGYSHLGGGYTDEKFSDGIYRIKVQSGVSPIGNEARVTKYWNRRAKDLCLGEFREKAFKVSVHDLSAAYVSQGEIGHYLTKASGYAVCSSFKGSYSEAIEKIDAPIKRQKKQLKHAKQQAQIEQNIILSKMKGGCDASIMGIDTLEQMGTEFYKIKQYKEAMGCYLSVYDKDKNDLVKVEAYTQIGLMYELGLGVEQDMDEAMKWYRLAKLM